MHQNGCLVCGKPAYGKMTLGSREAEFCHTHRVRVCKAVETAEREITAALLWDPQWDALPQIERFLRNE